jgi:hypothetical protein
LLNACWPLRRPRRPRPQAGHTADRQRHLQAALLPALHVRGQGRRLKAPILVWRCNFAKGVYVWRVNGVDKEGFHQQKARPARLTIC